ncbi:MAG: hypothetical protein N3G80_02560 [Candidatus Micrarchaeota archaeon]|nr:hypothetical protein [Candidatus Micrarchaeota archaeon]
MQNPTRQESGEQRTFLFLTKPNPIMESKKAALFLLSFFICILSATDEVWVEQDMILYYQSNIAPKIPKSAKMIIGDEKINAYVKGYVIGIETKRGELFNLQLREIENPTITVWISNNAYEQIKKRKMGVLEAIDKGEIRIEGKNLLSSLKIETAKRIYAVSGADNLFLKKVQ